MLPSSLGTWNVGHQCEACGLLSAVSVTSAGFSSRATAAAPLSASSFPCKPVWETTFISEVRTLGACRAWRRSTLELNNSRCLLRCSAAISWQLQGLMPCEELSRTCEAANLAPLAPRPPPAGGGTTSPRTPRPSRHHHYTPCLWGEGHPSPTSPSHHHYHTPAEEGRPLPPLQCSQQGGGDAGGRRVSLPPLVSGCCCGCCLARPRSPRRRVNWHIQDFPHTEENVSHRCPGSTLCIRHLMIEIALVTRGTC